MCLMMMDHLHFKISANGPEKDPGAQEMMNGAQMSQNSMMLLLGSPTPKAAVSEHKRYSSQVRSVGYAHMMTRVSTLSIHVIASYTSPQLQRMEIGASQERVGQPISKLHVQKDSPPQNRDLQKILEVALWPSSVHTYEHIHAYIQVTF